MEKAIQQNKKRIEWVDIGKYICIMCVILSHLQNGSGILDRLYAPFFLTTFFFLAGYVHKQPVSFREHMIKKTKGLLIPWFVFGNFMILSSAVMSFKADRNFVSELYWNLAQIRGYGDRMWFVAALFVAFIPFYFFIKLNKPVWSCVAASGLSIISLIYSYMMPAEVFPWNSNALPWHMEYVFQAMLWMILGYYFRMYGEKTFDRFNSKKNRCLLWIGYIAIVYIPITIEKMYYEISISYIRSLIGILAVIALCKTLRSNRYIRFVGANTLTYVGLHGKVFTVIEKIIEVLMGNAYEACLSNSFISGVLAIIITVIVSFVLIIPTVIINRYFPWVLGRENKYVIGIKNKRKEIRSEGI